MSRKKMIWLSAILIAVSQAVVWGGKGVASAANRNQQSLKQQLIEVNRHWREVQPNVEALPADWKVDSEVALIRTHLFLVIDHLRRADVSDLDATQRKNRRAHIAHLVRYTERGVFPVNQYVQGRRPVFIDAKGTHCAVGQLIADSGQDELAQRINREHKLAYIEQIKTPGVDQWQKLSGLSFAELALIQPGYTTDIPRNPREYGSVGNALMQLRALTTDAEGLPQRAIYSKEDEPLLSWRVAVLPLLGQKVLYDQFKLDEPWDSEHNKKLIEKMPKLYRAEDSGAPAGYATFLVPAGEKTSFPGKQRIKLPREANGRFVTAIVLEVDDKQAVPWTKPEELNVDEADWQTKLRNRDGKYFMLNGTGQFNSVPVGDAEKLALLVRCELNENEKWSKYVELRNNRSR